MTILKELSTRANAILRTGATLDAAAQRLNAEFQMCAYVNKNKLYGMFKDEDGVQRVRVLAA